MAVWWGNHQKGSVKPSQPSRRHGFCIFFLLPLPPSCTYCCLVSVPAASCLSCCCPTGQWWRFWPACFACFISEDKPRAEFRVAGTQRLNSEWANTEVEFSATPEPTQSVQSCRNQDCFYEKDPSSSSLSSFYDARDKRKTKQFGCVLDRELSRYLLTSVRLPFIPSQFELCIILCFSTAVPEGRTGGKASPGGEATPGLDIKGLVWKGL